jgi:hypothetical protein
MSTVQLVPQTKVCSLGATNTTTEDIQLKYKVSTEVVLNDEGGVSMRDQLETRSQFPAQESVECSIPIPLRPLR